MSLQAAPLYVPFTIGTAADGLSAEVNLQGGVLCGIMMPADWTAANITLQAGLRYSAEVAPAVFHDVYDDGGNLIVLVVAEDRFVVIAGPLDGVSLRYVKFRSSNALTVTPVIQGAIRSLVAIVRFM